MTTTDNESYWGQLRTKDEIQRHVSEIVFPNEPYINVKQRIKVITTDLPLITIDNFISNEMCDEIIEAAKATNKMKQSTLGVSQEVTKSRTSSTLWLREEECDVRLDILAGKVSRLIGLDVSHMENLQVVRYEEGQKFDLHTDHMESFNDLDCKGRLATCLVYLNSSSEGSLDEGTGNEGEFDGGSTYFPEYETHIIPTRGTAVFWFNTKNRPGSLGYTADMRLNVDERSRHAGSEIKNGEKWVCNRWVHPVPLYIGGSMTQ